jgi:hypothetical protein
LRYTTSETHVDGEFSDSIILLVPVDGEEYYDRFGKDVYTDYFPATKFMLNFKIKAGPYSMFLWGRLSVRT